MTIKFSPELLAQVPPEDLIRAARAQGRAIICMTPQDLRTFEIAPETWADITEVEMEALMEELQDRIEENCMDMIWQIVADLLDEFVLDKKAQP